MKGSRIISRIGVLALTIALLLAVLPTSALAEAYLEATGARVNVRTGPGNNYNDLYTLVRGETVTYTGEYAYDSRGVKWYKVQYYSYGTGWVSSKYSIVYGDASGSAPAPSASYVEATGNVHIRSTPKLTGTDLGTMSKGKTATYLGQSSTDDRGVVWYNVRYNGITGWVSSRYSKLCTGSSSSGSSSSGSSSGSSSSTTRYVTASGGDVNIRSTPRLTGTDLGTLKRGCSAVYLGQSSTDDRGVVWYNVRYNGITGWVSSRYSKLN